MTPNNFTNHIIRQRYHVIIEKNEGGDIIKITIVPKTAVKKFIKFISIVVIASSITYFLFAKSILTSPRGISVFLTSFLISELLIFRNPTIESLTVMKNYGLQINSTRGLLFLPSKWNERLFVQKEFIPRDRIIDVIINEGFVRGFQVIFYLSVLIKQSTKLRVLFPSTHPSLEDQRPIYNLVRKCLFTDEPLSKT